MDRIRELTTAALSLREERGLRTRLPLARLTVAGRDVQALEPFAGLLRDEVNVKAVSFTDDLEAFGRFVLKPQGKVLGPKLGGDTQKVMAAARQGDWQAGDEAPSPCRSRLGPDEFELALESREGEATAAVRSNVCWSTRHRAHARARGRGAARDVVRAQRPAQGPGLAVRPYVVTIDPDGPARRVQTHAATTRRGAGQLRCRHARARARHPRARARRPRGR
jgi:isoleucyl-tRNA synthetase